MTKKTERQQVDCEKVQVRVLPGDKVSAKHAALILDKSEKTLAMWRMRGQGPAWEKRGRSVFYRLEALDDWEIANTVIRARPGAAKEAR